MAILARRRVIGFYRLDFAPNAVTGRSFGAPSVGLRAFMLDTGSRAAVTARAPRWRCATTCNDGIRNGGCCC